MTAVLIVELKTAAGHTERALVAAFAAHLQRLLTSWGIAGERVMAAEFAGRTRIVGQTPVNAAILVDYQGPGAVAAQQQWTLGDLAGWEILPTVLSAVDGPTELAEVQQALGNIAGLGPALLVRPFVAGPSLVTVYSDGELLFSALAADLLARALQSLPAISRALDEFNLVAGAGRRLPESRCDDQISVERVGVEDERAAPLFSNLLVEYAARYANPHAGAELERYPAAEFEPPNGAFLLLRRGDQTIAGGAIRRYDHETAEVKRVWTSPEHRRQGLARRIMVELEKAAVGLGYRKIYLTTGSRQPEAVGLYLAAGYEPHFDQDRDPSTPGPLPFTKVLDIGLRALPSTGHRTVAQRRLLQPAGNGERHHFSGNEAFDAHTNCVPLAAAVWANRGG